MRQVVVEAPGGEPALRSLIEALGGDWHVEGAGEMWRAEQDGAVRRVVGLQAAGEGTCVIAWQAEAEVPDGPAYAAVLGAVAAGTVGLAVGIAVAGGVGGLLLGPAALGGTLAVSKRLIKRRLPDPAPVEAALGSQVRAAASRLWATRAG